MNGLSIDDVDDAVEMYGDEHTKNRYYYEIRPQLKLKLAEHESLQRYGDLDHIEESETRSLKEQPS